MMVFFTKTKAQVQEILERRRQQDRNIKALRVTIFMTSPLGVAVGLLSI